MSANTLDPAALLNWDFDVFNASTQWPNNYLAVVGDSAFRALNLHVTFKIGDECLGNWLDAVQQMYLDNPYHNALHVADVTQAVVFFLHSCELGQLLEPIEVLACVVSALVHDLGHFGKTNNFLKATNHDLALRFSDQSILENFHVSEGWKLCVDPKHNIFESLSENELGKVHELMVMMILDTDMARHAKITDTFATTIVGAEDLTLQDHRRLIMSMILHCADLANGSRTPRLSQNWSSMVMEEFFSQVLAVTCAIFGPFDHHVAGGRGEAVRIARVPEHGPRRGRGAQDQMPDDVPDVCD
eukprot:c15209_g1_i1.p1 GENE.c15209_g1_i1~~c15209_g1_i1.p1  ORF type:complete len:323 (+),score=53.25 c15209_g1_i1:68-970(+)